jgi:hypothetical protein
VQDPVRPRVFYAYIRAGAEPSSNTPPLTGLYRTDDEGLHWQWASNGIKLTLVGACCPHVLQMLPGHFEMSSLDTRILLFSNPTGLYLSHSSGRGWSRVTLPGSSAPVGGFDPCNGGVLYATTNRGVWRSFNAGSTWQVVPLKRPLDFAPASVVFDFPCEGGGGACYGCGVKVYGAPHSGHVRTVAPPSAPPAAGAVAVATGTNPFGPREQIVLGVHNLSDDGVSVSLTAGGFHHTERLSASDGRPDAANGWEAYTTLGVPSGRVGAPATLTVIVGKNRLHGTLHFVVGQDAVLTLQGHV